MNDVLILRKSEWNGADPELLHTCMENGGNMLRHPARSPGEGTMCCLGVDLTQRHDMRESDITGISMPMGVPFLPESAMYMRVKPPAKEGGPKYYDSFEVEASQTNDSKQLSVEQKVEALTRLYATIGVRVEYREDE